MLNSGFRPGDRVSFLDEVGGGEVVEWVGDELVKVMTDDGFELDIRVEKLVKREVQGDLDLLAVNAAQARRIAEQDRNSERQLAAQQKLKSPGVRQRQGRVEFDVMEIDLHLKEILDTDRGMTAGEKLEYQIAYFERMLATAIREKKRKMIVIHGIGEGRLRDAIRQVLGYYPGMIFRDADPRRYGYGATEVELH